MGYHIYVAGGPHPLEPPNVPPYEHWKIKPIMPTPAEWASFTAEEKRYKPIRPIKSVYDSLDKARKYIIDHITTMAPPDHHIYNDEFKLVGTLAYNRIEGLLWITFPTNYKSKLYAFKVQKLHPNGTLVRGSTRYLRSQSRYLR